MIEKGKQRAYNCVIVLKGGDTEADLQACFQALENQFCGAISLAQGYGNDPVHVLSVDAEKCGVKVC